MTVDAPRSRPDSQAWRSWSSFEKQLEKNSKATRDSFDFHPSCLCPDCLDARQDNTTFSAENENFALELEATNHRIDDLEKDLHNSKLPNFDIESVLNETEKKKEVSRERYIFSERLMLNCSFDDEDYDDKDEHDYENVWLSEDNLIPVGEDPRSVQGLSEVANLDMTASPSYNKFTILERQ